MLSHVQVRARQRMRCTSSLYDVISLEAAHSLFDHTLAYIRMTDETAHRGTADVSSARVETCGGRVVVESRQREVWKRHRGTPDERSLQLTMARGTEG